MCKFIFLIIFSGIYVASAQSFNTDLDLLLNNVPESAIVYYDTTTGNSSQFIQTKKKFTVLAPLQYTLGGLMYTYQNIISPQLSSNCAFQLTCSNFSKTAISEFGLIKGFFLTADRLNRCNHFSTESTPSYRIDENGKVIESIGDFSVKR